MRFRQGALPRTPLGELITLPRSPSGLGRGHLCPDLTPLSAFEPRHLDSRVFGARSSAPLALRSSCPRPWSPIYLLFNEYRRPCPHKPAASALLWRWLRRCHAVLSRTWWSQVARGRQRHVAMDNDISRIATELMARMLDPGTSRSSLAMCPNRPSLRVHTMALSWHAGNCGIRNGNNLMGVVWKKLWSRRIRQDPILGKVTPQILDTRFQIRTCCQVWLTFSELRSVALSS